MCYGEFVHRSQSSVALYTLQVRGSRRLMVTKLALEDSGRSQMVEAFTQLLGLPVCAQCSWDGHSSPHSQMVSRM